MVKTTRKQREALFRVFQRDFHKQIERHESYRGRTTPEIEWRVWNNNHSSFMPFKTKREAIAYANDGITQSRN